MKQDEKNLRKAGERQKVHKVARGSDNFDIHQIYREFLRP